MTDKSRMRNWMLLALTMTCVGCAAIQRRRDKAPPPIVHPNAPTWKNELSRAQELLASGHYDEAQSAFHDYQEKFPTSPYVMAAMLGEGEALEKAEHAPEAVPLFKHMIEVAREDDPSQREMRAEALHQLSLCYEAMGDDDRMIAVLLDLQSHAADIAKSVVEIEVPARLAAGYARRGNSQAAQSYFQQSETNFRKLQANGHFAFEKKWLAETLYVMGRGIFTNAKSDNLVERQESLRQGQKFLIRAVELQVEPFSQQSVDLLTQSYTQWLSDLKSGLEPSAKDTFALRATRLARQQAARTLVTLLDDAEQTLLPITSSTATLGEVKLHEQIQEDARQAQQLLYEVLPDTLMTSEAYQREGELKNVRLVDPPATLPKKKKKSTNP